MFTGTNVRIILDTGIALTSATGQKIRYNGPGDIKGEWDATIADTTIYYDTAKTDLSVAGPWQFQAIVETGNDLFKGEIATVWVYSPLDKE